MMLLSSGLPALAWRARARRQEPESKWVCVDTLSRGLRGLTENRRPLCATKGPWRCELSGLVKSWFVPLIVACVALQGGSVHGQQRGGKKLQTDKVQPVNVGQEIRISVSGIGRSSNLEARPWALAWPSTGIGKSVWARIDRSLAGNRPGCLGTKRTRSSFR